METTNLQLKKPRTREGWYWQTSDDGAAFGPYSSRESAVNDMWDDGFGEDLYNDLVAEEGADFAGTKQDFLDTYEWVAHMGAGPFSTDLFNADYVLENFEEHNEECVWHENPPEWSDLKDAKRELEQMLADALYRWAEKHDAWKQFRALT